MGCACSVDAGHGPAPEDLSNLPAPTLEELRMHREIDNVDFYSDAVSADEPSALAASVAMKARLLVFRLSHGIDDDPNQFQEEINANEPVVVLDDYEFVIEWMDENDVALDGDNPEPVPDVFAATSHDGTGPQQRAKEAVSRTSVKTQPATMQTAASVPTTCGAKPNHIRRRSSSSSAAAEAPPPPGTSSPPRQRDSGHAARGELHPSSPSRSMVHPAPQAACHRRRDGDAALPLPFRPPPPPPPPEGDSANAANGAGLSTSSLGGNEIQDALGSTSPGGKYRLPLSPATETTEVEPQSDGMELDGSARRSASPGAAAGPVVKPSQAAECETSPVPGAVGDG